MLPEPLTFPFRGQRAVDVLLIGGGLHLLSVYIPVLPLIVVAGYLVTTLSTIASRDWTTRFDSLPGFDDLGEIVRRGLGATFVVGLYLSPAFVTLLVTVFGLTEQSVDPGSITLGTSLGFVAGSTASILLAMSFIYFLPAALTNYGVRGRVRAAFDPSVLRSSAADAAYFYNVVVGLVVGSVLLSAAGALQRIAVGFFLAFYAEVVVVAFWSRGVTSIAAGERDGDRAMSSGE